MYYNDKDKKMTYNTEKRSALLNFLENGGAQAYTIEEICAGILTDGRGKSTVYRLVSRLVDEGLVRRISDGKTRHVTYQYIYSGSCADHMHLKCKECGRLIHLDDVTSHILEKRIMKSEGFALDDGALLYGRCDRCLYKREEATV